MAKAGPVSVRSMFGEYGLYGDGRLFALVCDNALFIKPTPAGRAFAPNLGEAPPYPGAKPCVVVPEERWDNAEWMGELARLTIAALPLPVRKSKKRAPA